MYQFWIIEYYIVKQNNSKNTGSQNLLLPQIKGNGCSENTSTEETLNFDEYIEFARHIDNGDSRGRAFPAFINQNHNGKTSLNLLFFFASKAPRNIYAANLSSIQFVHFSACAYTHPFRILLNV